MVCDLNADGVVIGGWDVVGSLDVVLVVVVDVLGVVVDRDFDVVGVVIRCWDVVGGLDEVVVGDEVEATTNNKIRHHYIQFTCAYYIFN